jgi:hypothetical protein
VVYHATGINTAPNLLSKPIENLSHCNRYLAVTMAFFALMDRPEKIFNFFQKGADYFATFFTTAW